MIPAPTEEPGCILKMIPEHWLVVRTSVATKGQRPDVHAHLGRFAGLRHQNSVVLGAALNVLAELG